MSNNESKGFGDTIYKITHFLHLDRLAKKVAKLFNKEDCGCQRRRDQLNKIIPYKNDKNQL
jgi:predicted N-acyltransferase